MFCINCGTQLPDDASFCSKCGKPQRNILDALPPTATPGRWVAKEFQEDISGHPIFQPKDRRESAQLDEAEMVRAMRDHIDAATKRLLARMVRDGWEPTEPTDSGRLALANRVITEHTHYIGQHDSSAWRLGEVRINFRRWFTQYELEETALYETCEFQVVIPPGKYFFRMPWTIEVVVTGPSGRTIAYTEKGSAENHKKIQIVLDKLASEYVRNGWEQLPSQRRFPLPLELPVLRRKFK